jgi:hypothetical protein
MAAHRQIRAWIAVSVSVQIIRICAQHGRIRHAHSVAQNGGYL